MNSGSGPRNRARTSQDGEIELLHHKALGCGRPVVILHGVTLDFRHMVEILEPADLELEEALLHKSVEGRSFPFPGRTYPTASVSGMARAVKRSGPLP